MSLRKSTQKLKIFSVNIVNIPLFFINTTIILNGFSIYKILVSYGTKYALYICMNTQLIAIPVFQERISPLLDEAKRFILLETEDGQIVQRTTITLSAESATLRIAKLWEIGVGSIISGAVSGFLSRFISEQGFMHYPWVSGPVDEVIDRFMAGSLKIAHDCTKPCRGTARSCGRGMHGKRNIIPQETDL